MGYYRTCILMKPNYIIIPLITVLVSVTGSYFTSSSLENWYQTINLPSWTPPGSVIGLVWTTIFILSTISALLVWNKLPHDRRFNQIIGLFLVNAVLNVGWSYLFFGQHLIGAAVIESGLLGLSVIGLIFLIWPLLRKAAILLVPYALWVSFATYLTYSVWLINR
jgi:benzodiazapine receptor